MQCNKQNLVVLTATLSFCALLVQQFYKLVKCNGSRICNAGVKPVETNSNLRQSENNEQNLQPTPDISFVLATLTPFWSCTHPLIHWSSTLKFWVITPLLESQVFSDTFDVRYLSDNNEETLGCLLVTLTWAVDDWLILGIWAFWARQDIPWLIDLAARVGLEPTPTVPNKDSKTGGLDLRSCWNALKH